MRPAEYTKHRRDLGDGLASYVKVKADHDQHPEVFFAVYRTEAVPDLRGALSYALACWESGGWFAPKPEDALVYAGRPTKGGRGRTRGTEEVRAMFAGLVERFRARVAEPREREQARTKRALAVLDAAAGEGD